VTPPGKSTTNVSTITVLDAGADDNFGSTPFRRSEGLTREPLAGTLDAAPMMLARLPAADYWEFEWH
jgi:hypothetical protein